MPSLNPAQSPARSTGRPSGGESSLVDRGLHLGRRALRRLRKGWPGHRRAIEACLQHPGPTDTRAAEAAFSKLFRIYPPRNRYTYDVASLLRRATDRAVRLIEYFGLDTPGASILEIGCGDGMLAALLECLGHHVTLVDLEDWRHRSGSGTKLILGDVCNGLPLEGESFDLICSFNTFEHVGDPRAALNEAARLCRPGGSIHLRFGPLYASAWGLHAYKTLPIPYAQFLFSEAFLRAKIAEVGIHDLGRDRDELQPLNRWRVDQFEACWHELGFELMHADRRIDADHLDLVHRFPTAFAGRSLTYDDLVVKSLQITLRKFNNEPRTSDNSSLDDSMGTSTR